MQTLLLAITLVLGLTLTAVDGGSSTETLRPSPEPTTRPGRADNIGKQSAKAFETEVTKTVKLDYLLSLPDGYEDDDQKTWPVVVFLHGAGERGNDVNRVATWGVPRLIASGKQIPAIVVSPQCPAGDWWTNKIPELSALLDQIETDYRVDQSCIYLTGMSMGGYGSIAWAAEEPKRFAAVAPVCGGGTEAAAAKIKDLPIWMFHGTEDPTVPADNSRNMLKWIEAAGGDKTKLTLYEGVDHISWTHAYGDERLWAWMFEQRGD